MPRQQGVERSLVATVGEERTEEIMDKLSEALGKIRKACDENA